MKVSYEKYAAVRDSANLNDAAVARLANVPKQTLSSWKTNKCEPKVATLAKITGLLGIPIEHVLVQDENE